MAQPKRTHKPIRLPRHLKVDRYRLMLHLGMKNFAFRGEETIYLRLVHPVRNIILHAKELSVSSAVFRKGSERIAARRIHADARAETVTFAFPRRLPTGRGELDLVFGGVMNEQMRGLYRSRYRAGTKERHLVTTQFESTDARMAFPCVDEPAAKAVFDVTLIVPKGRTAISNTVPVEVREHAGGYQLVRFAPTPKMSTYLLAFISGEFEWVERKTREGVRVRVFVTPGKKRQAAFALATAARVLSFYTRYFATPYPLPVLDMIAIPDFSAGAMENWGAITYRESAILVDPEHSSTANRQWVALVIAHEIAHQWFGNLVTMEWWTHLWLNEGFASYIEYLAVDHLFPRWDIWTQFVHLDLGSALAQDALRHTHPIEVDVGHPEEISEIFDAVSYQKGSSVIRMLADYLGPRGFRAGLRRYLTRHRYANAATQDLWRAFEEVSGKPVGRLMEAWTRRAGYPLLRIAETRRGLRLRQSRFFSSAVTRRAVRDATRWHIPIRYRREYARGNRKLLMAARVLDLPLRRRPGEWVLFNTGATGVFRVDYPTPMLRELEEAVVKKEIPPRDRFAVASDAFALAESGDLPTTSALALARAYRGETDYTVWLELSANLDLVRSEFWREPWSERYRAFGRSLFVPLARRMGWRPRRGERHTDVLLRSLALASAGAYGDEKTITRAKRSFAAARRGRPVPTDLRNVVYGLAAENGGRSEYERLQRMYRREPLQEERGRIGRALGCFRQPSLLARTLRFAISKHVRAQNTPGILAAVWANPCGRELAWRFLRRHWKFLLARYGQGGHTLPRLVKPIGVLASRTQAVHVRRFFKRAGAPGAERAVKQVVERIESNADWLRRDGKKIARWLEQHLESKTPPTQISVGRRNGRR